MYTYLTNMQNWHKDCSRAASKIDHKFLSDILGDEICVGELYTLGVVELGQEKFET